MTIKFSTTKKQRLCKLHSVLYKELVRAYFYDGYERADKLAIDAVQNKELSSTDAQWLMDLAQDFVATYRFVDVGAFTLDDADKQLNITAMLPNSDIESDALVIPTLHEVVAVE